MATVQNPITGRSKGIFGDSIFQTKNRKNILKSKGSKKEVEQTAALVASKHKFAFVRKFIAQNLETLNQTCKSAAQKKSVYSFMLSYYLNSCHYLDGETDKLLPEKLKFSFGANPPVNILEVTLNNARSVSINFDSQSGLSPIYDNDLVHVMVFNSATITSKYFDSVTTRSNGNLELTSLTDLFSNDSFYYVFTSNPNKSKWSNSILKLFSGSQYWTYYNDFDILPSSQFTTGQTLSIGLKVNPNSEALINWGDGSTQELINYSGSNYYQIYEHTFVSSSNRISLSNTENIISLYITQSSFEIIISNKLPVYLTYLLLSGNNINWTYSDALPVNLTYLFLSSNLINWTYSGALPVNLTYLLLSGNLINWSYSGALPVNLTTLFLLGPLINWTYSGALPVNITYLYFYGVLINWSYSGALPVNLSTLFLSSNLINWTYSGALPVNLTSLFLSSNLINWTYYNILGSTNFSKISLFNFSNSKLSDAQLISLLESLTNRTGNLPAAIILGDYSNYNNPPQTVLTAIENLLTAKPPLTSITLLS